MHHKHTLLACVCADSTTNEGERELFYLISSADSNGTNKMPYVSSYHGENDPIFYRWEVRNWEVNSGQWACWRGGWLIAL